MHTYWLQRQFNKKLGFSKKIFSEKVELVVGKRVENQGKPNFLFCQKVEL